jgi:hypothetical protein
MQSYIKMNNFFPRALRVCFKKMGSQDEMFFSENSVFGGLKMKKFFPNSKGHKNKP